MHEFYPVLEFGLADFENRYGYTDQDISKEQMEQFIHHLNTAIHEDEILMDRAWELFDMAAPECGLEPKLENKTNK